MDVRKGKNKTFDAKSAAKILWNFFTLCVLSILIGVLFGFIITYVLKKVRSVSHSAVHETFLIYCVTMLTYYTSGILDLSGITSLVSAAIVMAHYTWYNLSPQGQHITSVTFATFGYGAEAVVFSYIGLSLMSYKDYPWCWQFILFEFFIIITGRLVAIHLSYYMFNFFKGDQWNYLSCNEITFLAYAAFIRGVIAFGLVENLDENNFPHKKVLVSSVLCLVIATTIVIGSLTPLAKRFILPELRHVNLDSDS